MRSLFKKELNDIQSTATGWLYAIAFGVIPGLMLWFFPGTYNLLDNGYADLGMFFELTPILLLVMVPALSMKAFADEKRYKTWDLLQSRPASFTTIFRTKFLATWLFTTLCLLPSIVYVVTIWQIGFPQGNIDLGQTIVSYLSVLLLSAAFISIGLFASSLTQSSVVAFIMAVLINFTVFYGFNLVSELFSSGSWQVIVADFGLSNHYHEMGRGIFHLSSGFIFIIYSLLFSLAARFAATSKPANRIASYISLAILIIFIPASSRIKTISWDFTSDHRYTLSDYSKQMLRDLKASGESFRVNIYLEGDLNSGFVRLRKQLDYLLADLNSESNYRFQMEYINPSELKNSPKEVYQEMEKRGMKGVLLSEMDRNGRLSRQVIYPYAEMINGKDTLHVNFLKNIPGNTAEDNLKASAENLEYELMDAIRLFLHQESREIAFIEGHNELPRPYLYDAEEALARYYSVNRGEIGRDIHSLDPFRAVVIAGPTKKFSEQEKYILDQYIMKGGRVLWLVDGVYFSEEELAARGKSVTVGNRTSIDDLLFTYGVRINPALLQDEQSASILLSSGSGKQSQSAIVPWYFCPLLMPSPNHPVTKDIALVKAPYVSPLDVIKQPGVKANVLLTTSDKTHLVKATEQVDFDSESITNKDRYFDQKFLVAGVALEGKFTSAYINRIAPDSILQHGKPNKNESISTKMIVLGSSGIIRNEIAGEGQQSQVIPLGLDRISGMQFGNRNFIVNAVNWLANDDGWINLREKQQQLRLLNKVDIKQKRNLYVAINLSIPLLIICGYLAFLNVRRKRKYGRI